MTFRFRIGRPIDKETRRIALSQIDRAHDALSRGADLGAAIHDCRKCLKRVRALLRIVRPGLSAPQFRSADARVRDIARGLSASRDRAVARATLVAIETRAGVEPGSFCAAIGLFDGVATDGPDMVDGDAAKTAAAELLDVRDDFAELGRASLTRATVLDGFEQGFVAARRHLALAYAAHEEEPMHEWRKRVQRHWRHLQLVERVWPEEIGARIAQAEAISVLIGEHQDLSVLKGLVESGDSGRRLRRIARDVIGHCEVRQGEIRRLARPHGERLFADGASALARRIDIYWTAAEHERAEAKAKLSAGGDTVALGVMKPARGPATSRQGRLKS